MILSEMIVILRQELHDEDSNNYRWTSVVLTRHINRALAELSESIPMPVTATMPTVEGSRELNISLLTSRIMVAAVEYPVGVVPPDYQQFTIWGDTLAIVSGNQPDGNNCRIYYGVPHTMDAGGSTLPEKYIYLVAGGACGYAALELGQYLVNRVNTGGVVAPGELLEWGNQKLKIFRQEIQRLGRRNRIRVSDLSPAFYPPSSKDKDSGA